jgi:hypothetical protein
VDLAICTRGQAFTDGAVNESEIGLRARLITLDLVSAENSAPMKGQVRVQNCAREEKMRDLHAQKVFSKDGT